MATAVKQAESSMFDYIQKRQDAYARAMRTWLDIWAGWADAFTPSHTVESRPFGANAMVDRFYDSWAEILETQRTLAHSVIDVSTSAFEDSEQTLEEAAR